MKALCKSSWNAVDEFNPLHEVTLFEEGSVYKVWEGFYDKQPVLYAEAETGEVILIEESPELEKSANFQEIFEIISYAD